ncbi:MAG: DUF3256 family protein [Prevotella sp.]|nr:DUF3256 family protein [Prevotella sp.]
MNRLIKNLYRILLAGVLFLGMPVSISAQVADFFREIPDAILPTLSENNRLDMLDFMASNMKAEVTNRLGGKSEMTLLTDSTLSIQMSKALKVDMLLLTPETSADPESEDVICLIETFGIDSLSLESTVRFFTPTWQLLNEPPLLSVSDQNIISSKKVQTILKRDDEILKKN